MLETNDKKSITKIIGSLSREKTLSFKRFLQGWQIEIRSLFEYEKIPLGVIETSNSGREYRSSETTLLIEAVRSRNEDAIQILLNLGADVESLDGFALYEAFIQRDLSIIKLLLKRGAKIINEKRDSVIPTILLVLCSHNHYEKGIEWQKLPTLLECTLIEMVLNQLEKVELKGKSDEKRAYVSRFHQYARPLGLNSKKYTTCYFWMAKATNGDQFWLDYLEPDSESKKFNQTQGPLSKYYVKILKTLMELDLSVCRSYRFTSVGKEGENVISTRLFCEAYSGEDLLEHINIKEIKPLKHFIKLENLPVVEMLIKNGALDEDIKSRVDEEETALQIACSEQICGPLADSASETLKITLEMLEGPLEMLKGPWIIKTLLENISNFEDDAVRIAYINHRGPKRCDRVLDNETPLLSDEEPEIAYELISRKIGEPRDEVEYEKVYDNILKGLENLGTYVSLKSIIRQLMHRNDKSTLSALMRELQRYKYRIAPKLKNSYIMPCVRYLLSDGCMEFDEERALSIVDRFISVNHKESLELSDEIRDFSDCIFEYIWGKYIESVTLETHVHKEIYSKMGDFTYQDDGKDGGNQVGLSEYGRLRALNQNKKQAVQTFMSECDGYKKLGTGAEAPKRFLHLFEENLAALIKRSLHIEHSRESKNHRSEATGILRKNILSVVVKSKPTKQKLELILSIGLENLGTPRELLTDVLSVDNSIVLLRLLLNKGYEEYWMNYYNGEHLIPALSAAMNVHLLESYYKWAASNQEKSDEPIRDRVTLSTVDQLLKMKTKDIGRVYTEELLEEGSEDTGAAFNRIKHTRDNRIEILMILVKNAVNRRAILSRNNPREYEARVKALFEESKVCKKTEDDLKVCINTGLIRGRTVLKSGVSVLSMGCRYGGFEDLAALMIITRMDVEREAKGSADKEYLEKELDQEGKEAVELIQEILSEKKSSRLDSGLKKYHLNRTILKKTPEERIERLRAGIEENYEDEEIQSCMFTIGYDREYVGYNLFARLLDNNLLISAFSNSDQKSLEVVLKEFRRYDQEIDREEILSDLIELDLPLDVQVRNIEIIKNWGGDTLFFGEISLAEWYERVIVNSQRNYFEYKSGSTEGPGITLQTILKNTSNDVETWLAASKKFTDRLVCMHLYDKPSDGFGDIISHYKTIDDALYKLWRKKTRQSSHKKEWPNWSLIQRQDMKINILKWGVENYDFPKMPEGIKGAVDTIHKSICPRLREDRIDRLEIAIDRYLFDRKNEVVLPRGRDVLRDGQMVLIGTDDEKRRFLEKWENSPEVLVRDDDIKGVQIEKGIFTRAKTFFYSMYYELECSTWNLIGEFLAGNEKEKAISLRCSHKKHMRDTLFRDMVMMKYLAQKLLPEEQVKSVQQIWLKNANEVISKMRSCRSGEKIKLKVGREIYEAERVNKINAWIWLGKACRRSQVKDIVDAYLSEGGILDTKTGEALAKKITKSKSLMQTLYNQMSIENQSCVNWHILLCTWLGKIKCLAESLAQMEQRECNGKISADIEQFIKSEQCYEQLVQSESCIKQAYAVIGESNCQVVDSIYEVMRNSSHQTFMEEKVEACCKLLSNTKLRISNEIKRWKASITLELILVLMRCSNDTEKKIGKCLLKTVINSSLKSVDEKAKGACYEKVVARMQKRNKKQESQGLSGIFEMVRQSEDCVLSIFKEEAGSISIRLAEGVKVAILVAVEDEQRDDAEEEINVMMNGYIDRAISQCDEKMEYTHKRSRKTQSGHVCIKSYSHRNISEKIGHSTRLWAEGGLISLVLDLYTILEKREYSSYLREKLEKAWKDSCLLELEQGEESCKRRKSMKEEAQELLRIKGEHSQYVSSEWILLLSENPPFKGTEKIVKDQELACNNGEKASTRLSEKDRESLRCEKKSAGQAAENRGALTREEEQKSLMVSENCVAQATDNGHDRGDGLKEVCSERDRQVNEEKLASPGNQVKSENNRKKAYLIDFQSGLRSQIADISVSIDYYSCQETIEMIKEIKECLCTMDTIIESTLRNEKLTSGFIESFKENAFRLHKKFKLHNEMSVEQTSKRENISHLWFSGIEDNVKHLVDIINKRELEDKGIDKRATEIKEAEREKAIRKEEAMNRLPEGGKEKKLKLGMREVHITSNFNRAYSQVERLKETGEEYLETKIDLVWARYMAGLCKDGLEYRVSAEDNDLANAIFHWVMPTKVIKSSQDDFILTLREIIWKIRAGSKYELSKENLTFKERVESIVLMARWVDLLINRREKVGQDYEDATLISFLILSRVHDEIKQYDQGIRAKYQEFLKQPYRESSLKKYIAKISILREKAAHATNLKSGNIMFSESGTLKLGQVPSESELMALVRATDFFKGLLEHNLHQEAECVEYTAGSTDMVKSKKKKVMVKNIIEEREQLKGEFGRAHTFAKEIYDLTLEGISLDNTHEKRLDRQRLIKNTGERLQAVLVNISGAISKVDETYGQDVGGEFIFFRDDGTLGSSDQVSESTNISLFKQKYDDYKVVVDHKVYGNYSIWTSQREESAVKKEMIRVIDGYQVIEYSRK